MSLQERKAVAASHRRGAPGPGRYGGTRSVDRAYPPGGEVALLAEFPQIARIRMVLSAMVSDKTGVPLKGCLEVIGQKTFDLGGPAWMGNPLLIILRKFL